MEYKKCLICGNDYQNLGGHIKYVHNLKPKEYYDLYIKQPNEGLCPICGKETSFIKLSKGYHTYCSTKCMRNAPEIKEKIAKTNIERLGCANPFQNKEIIEHIKKVTDRQQVVKSQRKNLQEKYGVINTGQIPEVIDKMQKHKLENKIKFEQENNCTRLKTLTKLYGFGWYMSDLLNIPKIRYCNTTFISNDYIPLIKEYYEYHNENCASEPEKQIYEAIKSIYDKTIIQNNRKIIKPLELDIYLPDISLAIEYNGTYWHSIEKGLPKDYHLNKSLLCRKQNIRLIYIYQFEDLNEQIELLKSVINGKDLYNPNDFNKNNMIDNIPIPQIIYKDLYTIYGAGKLY